MLYLMQVTSADRAWQDRQLDVCGCQSRHAVLLPLLQSAFLSTCPAYHIPHTAVFPDQVRALAVRTTCMSFHYVLHTPCQVTSKIDL